ncbi:MAG: cysteine hydrolase [Lactobacillales bacterium]|jgi:niacin transporter|nr:cysteine hydrolase [Lactobacillales bacterium]
MRALISIDYTYDFVAEDGKLTTGKAGQAIHDAVFEITKTFTESGDFVAYMIDNHDPNDSYHPEMKLFPPHNVQGTSGRRLYGKLQEYYDKTKNQENVYWHDKRHYSAFSGTDLDIRLREREIHELILIGVCTDICVLHTAVDAYNLGYQLVIPKDCVASFDQVGHEWALHHFESTLGAKIV